MNAGQVATSDGEFYRKPQSKKLTGKWKRYQRKLARQQKGSNRRGVTKRKAKNAARKMARRRDDWQHKTTRTIADAYGTVVAEDLNTKGMTRKGGRRKRGLNRVILDTGWSALQRKLAYKSVNFIKVDPKNTSRECHECGHAAKENRRSQALFACGSCGNESNADVNAALNIRRRGLARLDVEGRRRSRASPKSRQIDPYALVAA